MNTERFRILSLDGGGIRGTFTASVVAGLEATIGHSLAQHFDLITGTSTGGIIALGLGLGLKGNELLNLYVTRGPEIFGSTGIYRRATQTLRGVFRPKHSLSLLERHLKAAFGERKVGESANRLVIPSFGCNGGGRVQLFKTSHHPDYVLDYKELASEVALATAAAPTYFRASIAADGQTFLDGGVWANCPVVVGLLEAIHVLDIKPSQIDVLSIGTTEELFEIGPERRQGGILGWGTGIVDLLMQAQTKGALAQSKIITRRGIHRIDTIVPKGRFRMDDTKQIDELAASGRSCARAAYEERVIPERFFSTFAKSFTPYHKL